MSADILGTNCDQCLSMVQCCFMSTETVRLIRTESPGRPPRATFTQFLNSELMGEHKQSYIGHGIRPGSGGPFHTCKRNLTTLR